MAVRNTTDALLARARVPFWASVLRRIGAPVPVDLDRGAWTEQRITTAGVALTGKRVGVVGVADVGADGSGSRAHADGSGSSLQDQAMLTAALTRNGAVAERAGKGSSGLHGVVIDCGSTLTPASAPALFRAAQSVLKAVQRGGKVAVVARQAVEPPALDGGAALAGLHGFVASLSKEVAYAGVAVNCVVEAPGHRDVASLAGPLSYFLSNDAAFVTGQTLRLSRAGPASVVAGVGATPSQPRGLSGKVALVTGAGRGIGAAITDRLVLEGATVIAVDMPQVGVPCRADAAPLVCHCALFDRLCPGRCCSGGCCRETP